MNAWPFRASVGSAPVSVNLSLGLGVSVRQLASHPAPLTEDRHSATSQKTPLHYLIVLAMILHCCGLI